MTEEDMPIPIKKDQEILVEIEGVGRKGDGIAKYNNYTVIVPNGKRGERYKVKVTNVLPKFCFAEIVD